MQLLSVKHKLDEGALVSGSGCAPFPTAGAQSGGE